MSNIYSWQADTWRSLTRSDSARGHALLLKGGRGIGKIAFARNLAKSLLCERPNSAAEHCGTCPSCGWFDQGGHPDFRLIEPESLAALTDESTSDQGGDGQNATESAPPGTKAKKKPSKQIGVDQIRALADLVNMTSHRNGYKIILIHPAESMNPSAANALLKNLEEPPPQTLFILVTHRPQDLLPTLRSRCRQIAMPSPDRATSIAWLKGQGIKDPENSLAAAGYAPLSALEQNDEDYLVQYQSFIRQVGTPGGLNPISLAEEMQRSDLPTAVGWMQRWCYDLMSFRTTGKVRYHLNMLEPIKLLVSEIDPRRIAKYSRGLISTQRLSNHPLNPRLFLEEMLISYAMMVSPSRNKQTD